jgi:hypothetical protein
MKPTPQISSNENASKPFPATDYGYQPTTDLRTRAAVIRPGTRPLAFHKLSSEFFNTEAPRQSVTELLGFGLVTAISAWPIASALIAMVRLARNY